MEKPISDSDQDAAAKREKAREANRRSMFLSATVAFGDKVQPVAVRVRNLSAGGIMIESAQVLPEGHRVVCDVKGIGEIPGTVAWATGGRMGISFDNEVDPAAARYSPDKTSVIPPGPPLVIPTRRPGLAIR